MAATTKRSLQKSPIAMQNPCWRHEICGNQPVLLCRFSRRPQYQPLSLRRLQYLIDLGRVDPERPIDLTQLVNGRGVTVQPLKKDFGVQLVDDVGCRARRTSLTLTREERLVDKCSDYDYLKKIIS